VAQLRIRPLGQDCQRRPQGDLSEGLSICRPVGRVLACRIVFPILEAQHGGRWTVTVRKLSPAPAVVSVAFHFE
jgi:hypothetical protein